ncbi:unnamed protein product [Cladocopium goreaui]|uniref:Uncharacterized protein n=1 Tax=Cladocopium goreaui TaxID=2562237 RepID=A0A9P1FT53_9DINO|nr:unnamed protein product [Cladocopium goreaui]
MWCTVFFYVLASTLFWSKPFAALKLGRWCPLTSLEKHQLAGNMGLHWTGILCHSGGSSSCDAGRTAGISGFSEMASCMSIRACVAKAFGLIPQGFLASPTPGPGFQVDQRWIKEGGMRGSSSYSSSDIQPAEMDFIYVAPVAVSQVHVAFPISAIWNG